MIIKTILLFLIKIGTAAASVLPLHVPLELPDMAPIFALLQSFAGFDRWVSLPVLLTVVGLVLLVEFAIGIYWIYRQVIGLIPTFK